MFSSLKQAWPWPILAIPCRPFGFKVQIKKYIFGFPSFGLTWWRLLYKRVVHIKCDIYNFIFSLRILIYQCHIWMSTKEIIAYMKSFPSFIMLNDERYHFHPIWLYYNQRYITLNWILVTGGSLIPSINPQIWLWPVRPHVVDGYLSEWVTEWLSDCCLTSTQQVFSYSMVRS
jgi:hypothetical protein